MSFSAKNAAANLAKIVALAVVYFVAARIGLALDAVGGFATLVWPPTGIALATLYLFGNRLWPGVAAGAFLANVYVGASAITASGIALGNTLEALVGALLLVRSGFQPNLRRLQDVVRLMLLAATLATTISATLGVCSLWLSGSIAESAIRSTWTAWWVGDALGALIVAPLIMVWASNRKTPSPKLEAQAVLERVGFLVFLCVCGILFSQASHVSALFAIPVLYLIFPVFMWSALRFGLRTTVTTIFVISLFTIFATSQGLGPFARDSLQEGLATLHFFLGAVAVTALTLAAAVAERIPIAAFHRESMNRRGAEEKYSALLRVANDAFVAMDHDGKIIEWNAQAEKTFGWSREEAIGLTVAETLIPQRLRQEHEHGLRLFFSSGYARIINRRIEMPALHKSGVEIPIELTVSVAQNLNGHSVFGAFLHDISARRRNQRVNAIQLAVTQDLVGSLSIHEAAAKVLETIGSGLGWEFGAIWIPRPAGDVLECLEAWCPGEEKKEFVTISKGLTFKLGVGLPGRIWASGKPLWIVDVSDDDNFPRGPVAARINLHGAFAFPIVRGNRVVGVMEFFSAAIEQPVPVLLEVIADIGIRFGSFIQRYEAEVSVKTLSQGLERLVAERTAELTKANEILKRSQQELKAAMDSADAANRAKTFFLANMSHEIRTPLGAVIGFSELLASDDVSSSEKLEYSTAIKRNSDLLTNIIDDVLDLSKVEAGKLVVERRDVALAEILSDTTSILKFHAQEKGLKLHVAVDEQVPTHLETDPLRLRQILLNIVGNAIKFTERGAIDISVRAAETSLARLQVVFDVKDTGQGIPAEQAAKLFAPFSQADVTTKRRFGGSGLGLVLSRRLAHLLDGDVVLTASSPGQGSTFTITIDGGPFERFRAVRPQMKILAPVSTGAPRLEGVEVLLAEDAADIQKLVHRILSRAGSKVEIVDNGSLAIERVKAKRFDIVLMDLQMPIMDGYEAAAELRRIGYTGPIIALTAHALKEDRQRCLERGFTDHLSKPVDHKLLVERVAFLTGHFG